MGWVGLLLAVAALGLAGCGAPEATHDRAYFAGHPDARTEILEQCRNDPGRLDGTPNCLNALAAESDTEHERAFHGHRPVVVGTTRPDHL